jgi:hypothetical protein
VWTFFLSARFLGIGIHDRISASELADRANLVASVATVFAYLAVGLVGLPIVHWWSRWRTLALGDLARLGLALGGVPFLVYGVIGLGIGLWEVLSQPPDPMYGAWNRWLRQLREMVVLTGLGAASGMATAALYWAIAVRGSGKGSPPAGRPRHPRGIT